MRTSQDIVDAITCDTINLSGLGRSAGISRDRLRRIVRYPESMTLDESNRLITALESISTVKTVDAA